MHERAIVVKKATLERTVAFFDAGPVRRGLYSLVKGLRRHHVGRAASAMAFNLFLAAIPMLALAGWLIALVLRQSPEALGSTSLLLDLTPYQVHLLIKRNFGRFSAGAVAPFALVGSLWLASSAYHTLMSVFETMVGARRRAWVTKRLIAVGCVFVTIVIFALTGTIAVWVAGGPSVILGSLVQGNGVEAPLAQLVTVSVLLMGATSALAGFFRIAVIRPGVRRRVWPGAFVTVAIGGIISYLFGYYARVIAEFALFYGSLAAVAIALAWLWIWCAAMLIGAELNAQLEGGDRTPPSTVL
jgi:membrane protein